MCAWPPPAQADPAAVCREGVTRYVSQLGSDSSGSSSTNAFRASHTARDAVPDDRQGRRGSGRPTINPRSALRKTAGVLRDRCEVTPVLWQGRRCILKCIRPIGGGPRNDHFLVFEDLQAGKQLARFATGYNLAFAYVRAGTLYVFASRFEARRGPWNDVTLFKSSDLIH